MKWHLTVLILLISTALPGAPAIGSTLENVRARGFLLCGVSQDLPGFSRQEGKVWKGFDIDFCRAVSAAIFAVPDKVKFVGLSAGTGFTALNEKKIDLLARGSSWTMGQELNNDVHYAGVLYYDQQRFMVRKKFGVTSALELSGATVCAPEGTTSKLNAEDYFKLKKMPFEIVPFETTAGVIQAYEAGRCDVYTSDNSALIANRLTLAKPGDHIILPDIIGREPLGPVVRNEDDQWFNIIKWVVNALINAEELGVGRANVVAQKTTKNPAILRLLGDSGDFGAKLGLDKNWARNILLHVGNYGDIFNANLGPKTSLQLMRKKNRLWTKGGLLYAPPIR